MLIFFLVPGEFTYKACNQTSPAKEADNKQEVYISPNKIQYWAMYPKYFLKSYGITMKVCRIFYSHSEVNNIVICD